MPLELQILIAFALDALVGDPRWLPHPVRGIGWLALRLETVTRRLIGWQRGAGIVTALLTISISGGAAWGLIYLAGRAHPLAGDAAAIVVLYTCLAARDLAGHAMAVHRRLAAGELEQARLAVSRMVGRDTDRLDESGVARAAVESVAENTVDGVTAPLLFAIVGGPVAAIVYKAINTLDSTFGYKNERYLYFGWASARIDDLANYLPARLTGPVVCLASALLGRPVRRAFRVLARDARNHTSPNSGFAEAAMAGALGVQLGGLNYYFGQPMEKPTIGDAAEPVSPAHIPAACKLMYLTAILFLALGLAGRLGVMELWQAWRIST